MLKRTTTIAATLFLTHAVLGSVVFMGVPLSSRLLGQWRVVQVFGSDLSRSLPPFTVRFDRDGQLVGRSGCRTFTGQWSTGRDQVRVQGLVSSSGDCGELRAVERQVMEAMGGAREARVERDGVVLFHQGKPVARLVPQQT